jgi:DNA-binding NtrC family response regulator
VRQLENLLEREFLLSEGHESLHLSTVPEGNGAEVAGNGDLAADGWNYRHAKASAMEKFDRGFLETLLRFASGNVSLAARLAGKERRDLGRLLRKYAIVPRTFRSET